MHHPAVRRLAVLLALSAGGWPFLLQPIGAAPREEPTKTYEGKVVPLSGLLEKIGSKLDSDAAPHWLALVTDDGEVYPLIPDDGGRCFFKDKALLNRPMRLSARRFGDTNLLQVLQVQSIVKGQAHEVYYWCDICSIKRREKMTCECCGGPMELREEPVSK